MISLARYGDGRFAHEIVVSAQWWAIRKRRAITLLPGVRAEILDASFDLYSVAQRHVAGEA